MSSHPVPSYSEIRNKTQEVFGRRPCLWQIQVVHAILKGERDVVSISATGSGKTLTFWMPLLFRPQGIQIVVAPLNILGTQNVVSLDKLGIKAFALHAESATHENFKAIEDGKYRVIITNPETLMKDDGGFEKLWKTEKFTSRVISVVWDEAHCISKWGDFRPEYKLAGRLRYLIPEGIPYFVTSATLPPAVLDDVSDIMRLRKNTYTLKRSNDRPNVHLVVREFQYAMNSFLDLAFLVPDNPGPHWKPPKFLVFFDDIAESVAATKFLKSRLPPEYHGQLKVVWFNADMTPEFRDDHTTKLTNGEVLGLCCTDSFGMGIDLQDIELIIQWRVTCDLCTLWQRFGRGARNPTLQATALLFVESKYLDANRQKKAENKEKRAQKQLKKKRKVDDTKDINSSGHPSKRLRLAAETPSGNGPALGGPEATMLQVDGVRSGAATEKDAQVSTDPRDELDAERERVYAKRETKNGEKVKITGDGLEPAMDDLVNAATRHFKCYRRPVMVYFGNTQHASHHEQCDINSPTGCSRCVINTPTICCELCSPNHFKDFARVSIPKPTTAPSRSKIKDYTAARSDMELRDALHDYRKTLCIQKFGPANFKNYGAGAVMSHAILQRIVDCAHACKIQSKEDLARETKWGGANEYGDEVVKLIKAHSNPPRTTTPLVSTPLRACAQASNQPALSVLRDVRTPAKRQCSKCGALDHIGAFHVFLPVSLSIHA
ncbi:P-loop containing nucleoside triphosphate hydrolase protein [Leucogyrophana mollusca]|uniref:P-loop containing nucleoside triphosphate hydrolase protein n=1 Tax=Leucogyrophana mollusca TaxID=85980 RepID=A0ACB8AW53_9AGAM|nr:P-loop containing nucleoside triphosphate hydrolase protein [Leucogyrophana mollusca]